MRSALYYTDKLPTTTARMSLHLNISSWVRVNQSLFPYCYVHSGEATNTNCLVFNFTRLGLEPTIYRTRGEHANHYTIVAVEVHTMIEITIFVSEVHMII
jgi:hypothetical protein